MIRLSVRARSIPRRGFTLTEVLLVLAILGVIAAMVVPNLLGRQKEALIRTSKMSIKSLEEACTQYAISHEGDFPQGSNKEAFGVLLNPGVDTDGKPISPYLKSVPNDAWNNELNYQFPPKVAEATVPSIWSSGPNRQNEDGGGDDITNWK
ncbi:MAG: type II secretion system protein GspG [Planctomycetes bacterium]|nr:type II secretion system protein GspG [Planctomycetota bacterium]